MNEFHIQNLCKKCSNLSGWILRTFTTRYSITMMTLFKSLVLPRLDYGSQLWSPHLVKHIVYYSERRGRSCIISHVNLGRLWSLAYNSFRWRAIHLFNAMSKYIRCISSCSVVSFESKLDCYLKNIIDLPGRPGFSNSLDSITLGCSAASSCQLGHHGVSAMFNPCWL